MRELEKTNARLQHLVSEKELDIQIPRGWKVGNSEPGAVAPGGRARDGRAEGLVPTRVPRGRATPQHAAPHGTAEPASGQAGGQNAGDSHGERAPWPALHHGFAAEGALVGRREADQAAEEAGGPAGARDPRETQADRHGQERRRASSRGDEERGVGHGLRAGPHRPRPPLPHAGGAG